MEDHETMRIVEDGLKGLKSSAESMAKSGQNLSDIKIKIGLPGGAHVDFCKIAEQVKEVNIKYKYGYDSILESLGSFKVGNWSELLAKCAMLLPYVHEFKIKLTPKPGGGRFKADPWS